METSVLVGILTKCLANTSLAILSHVLREKPRGLARYTLKDTLVLHRFKSSTSISRPVLSLLVQLLSQIMMKRSSSSNLFQPRKPYLHCYIEDPEMDGKLLTSTPVLTTKVRL